MISKVLKKFLQKKNINTVDYFLDKVSRKMGGATFMQVGAKLLDFSVRLRQLNYNLFFLSNDCFAVDRNFQV